MKISPKVSNIFAAFAAAVALGSIAHATNLVSNGNFSTGDFTGWTHTGASGWISVSVGAGPSGENTWHEGAVGSESNLSQNLSTVSGTKYSISLWLDPVEGSVSDYNVMWGGATVFDWNQTDSTVTTAGTWTVLNNGGVFTQNQWNHIFIDPWATSSITTLTLGIRQDPGYSNLTNVDVEGAGITSAPDQSVGWTASAVLLGLCALSAYHNRRRQLA